MLKAKRIFEKACSVAVIAYLFYPFFIQARKEIELFYTRLIGFLLALIQGNEIVVAVCSVAFCLLGIFLILWIFRNGEEKAIEEKQEEGEE